MYFFMLDEQQWHTRPKRMFERVGLCVKTTLGVLLFVVVPASVGLAKDHPTRRGPAARHSQFLCTSDGLQLFRISGSGTLKPVAYSFADDLPLPQTDGIGELLPDPQGRSLYVSWTMTYNQGSAIAAEVDRMWVSRRGKLFSVSHQAFPLDSSGGGPRSLALAEQGKLLLVVFNSGQTSKPFKTFLRAYRVQPRGPLRPASKPVALRNNFQSITVDPTDHYVYIIYTHDSRIHQYSILPNAALSPLGVASAPTAKQPATIIFHPSRRFAYVTSRGENSVALYREGRDGKLSLSANYYPDKNKIAPTLAPTLAITPDGRFLYICSPKGKTFQYRIWTNGVLQPLTPKAIPFGGYKMIVDPTGKFSYSLSNTTGINVIYQYCIRGDGTLLPLVPRFVSKIGTPGSMTIVQN